MRLAIASTLVLIACGPGPSAAPVETPAVDSIEADAKTERHVVVAGGTPLYQAVDDEQPRGWLGDAEDIGGWTMRVVDTVGDRIRVSADLDASAESCARDVEGLRGLGIEVYVPKSALATVVTREVTLTADECETIVARPGVVVTPLCEEGGSTRYRVGSCPNADCVYAVPADAIGHTYVPRVRIAAAKPSGDDAFPMACVDALDAMGGRQPHAVQGNGLFGGTPATGLSRWGSKPVDGKLPACEHSTEALFCDVDPRLGFDHVHYELREGTPVTWRDGTAAGVATRAHRSRAVPYAVADRLCWGAVEGSSRAKDLELCAAADAIQRVEEAHAALLQARRDGKRTHWFPRKLTACYVDTLATSPGLAGRVHARFRVTKSGTTLERVTRPGDEAFAQCIASKLDDKAREPHTLELVIDLYPPTRSGSPTTGAGG